MWAASAGGGAGWADWTASAGIGGAYGWVYVAGYGSGSTDPGSSSSAGEPVATWLGRYTEAYAVGGSVACTCDYTVAVAAENVSN